MNSVGLDVHKARCVACIKTHEGRILEEFTFQNNPHGHEELLTHLKADRLTETIAISAIDNPEVKLLIEFTGILLQRHAPPKRDRTNRAIRVAEETCQLCRPRTQHPSIWR